MTGGAVDYAPMVTLVGVHGEQIALSSSGEAGNIVLRKGAQGLDMVPWDVQVDEFPARAGATIRAVRATQREIMLPLTVWGDSRPEMVTAKRRLISALDPGSMAYRRPKLVVAEYDETGVLVPHRELDVYYAGGLEGDEGDDAGMSWNRFAVILRSEDPFFRATADTVADFYQYPSSITFFRDDGQLLSPDGVAQGFALNPMPVFQTSIVVDNPGDVSVYPTFTFTGPATGAVTLTRGATNYSPEQKLVIPALNVAAGKTWQLVTEPGRLAVKTSSGTVSGWSALEINPDFWTADPGLNAVSITGLTTIPAAATITFRPKYQGM